MTTRRVAAWWGLVCSVALGLAGPSRGQDAPRQTFTAANGLIVEVRSDGQASEAQVLAALEEAVRAIRDRAALSPVLPSEAGAVTDIPAPAPAPTLAQDGYGCGDGANVCHWHGLTFIGLPPTLLWEPPLANPHEPHMRLVLSNLKDQFTRDTVDTGIGATVGLMRVTDDATKLSIQQDVFADVQTRFSHWHYLVDAEYRFGLPLTFPYGPREAKTSFEHTSTHQGDGAIPSV